MKQLLFILTTLLALASCSKDDGLETPPTPITTAERTVIIYMSAENDLNNYVQGPINSTAQPDLDEIIKGYQEVASSANLVVFIDKASSFERPFIARVTTSAQQPLDTLYQYEQDFYASDPDQMRDVLERAKYYCPATRDYGLVLWGHANGWIIENDSVATSRRAYGRDTGTNTASSSGGKWLNIPSMREALQMTGIHWKFIFSDCCNMQCVEVAYELRNETDYFIASPAEITGVGAPYETMVKDFFIADDMAMIHAICDDYHAQKTNSIGRFDGLLNCQLPISAISTASLQQLADATRQVLPDVASYLSTVPNPESGIIYYYAFNKLVDNEKTMYDMYDMIRAALDGQPDKFKGWETSFNAAVIYKLMSERWHANTVDFSDFTVTSGKFGGVSMFFPMEKYKNTLSHKYNDTIRQLAWYYAVGCPEVGW